MTKVAVNAYLLKILVIFSCLIVGCGNGTPPKGNASQSGKGPAKTAKPAEKMPAESAGNRGKPTRSKIEQRLLTILRCYYDAADFNAMKPFIHSDSFLLLGDQSLHSLAYLRPKEPKIENKVFAFRYLGIDGEYAICRAKWTSTVENVTLATDTLWGFRKEEGQWKLWQDWDLECRPGMISTKALAPVTIPRDEAEAADMQKQLRNVLLEETFHSQSPMLSASEVWAQDNLRRTYAKLEVVTFRYLATNGDYAFCGAKLKGKINKRELLPASAKDIAALERHMEYLNAFFVFRQEEGKWRLWRQAPLFKWR